MTELIRILISFVTSSRNDLTASNSRVVDVSMNRIQKLGHKVLSSSSVSSDLNVGLGVLTKLSQ